LIRDGGGGLEGDGFGQTHAIGKGIGDPAPSGIETGVGVEQSDAGTDEPVDAAPLGVGGRDVVGPAQVERVVGDDHVDAGVDGLIDDGCHGVDGQQDAAYRVRRVATDESIGVPGCGQTWRCSGFHEGDNVTDAQRVVRVVP